MKKYRIYLGGAITGTTLEEHNGWRLQLTSLIEDATKSKVVTFNPVDHISEFRPMRDWGLNYDLNMLRNSDLLIVNLDYNDHSIGTNIEIGVAIERNIPILIYHTQPLEMHEWHKHAAEAVFDNYNDMLEYLINHYIGEWCL